MGLIVEPKKRYTQTVQASFHVSNAVIDPEYKGDDTVSLFVQVEGQDYALTILKKNERSSLDLNFDEGMQIAFHTKGIATVHLTGYLYPSDDDEMDDSFLDDEEEDVTDEEEEVPQLTATEAKLSKKDKKNKQVVAAAVESETDEDQEEEEESESEEEAVPVKPTKKSPKAEQTTPQKENGEQLSKNQLKKQKKQEKAQVVEKKVPNKALQGGVIVEELKVGTGPEAKSGKKVAVYYVGKLKSNNKQFDATQKGNGFKFRLGAGEVIKGWDVGVVGMKVGGKRRIVVPHQMAYGTKGAPPAIPPNSTLVFDVELRAVN